MFTWLIYPTKVRFGQFLIIHNSKSNITKKSKYDAEKIIQ